jgi:hypothetical protein
VRSHIPIAVLLMLGLLAVAPAMRIGVEMPRAGDDGARGLAVLTAIQLAAGTENVVARDSSYGGFLNPHRDEGSDNVVDREVAPQIIFSFSRAAGIIGVVGGLRRNVGDIDAEIADAYGVPTIVLARWSHHHFPHPSAFCMCPSPPRIVRFARTTARARFGKSLFVVLAGEADRLITRSAWPRLFDGLEYARVDDNPQTIDVARYRARGADAVLVIADERPLTLWRGAAFQRFVDADYLRSLAHRDYRIVPAGASARDVVVVGERLPDGAGRRAFARRFHAAAGFQPPDEAIRAYAAAQIMRAAAAATDTVPAALRGRRFDTIAGPVRFDSYGFRSTVDLRASPP